MAKMKYQLVIFDWDGTMMDSAPRIGSSMQKAGELAGLASLTYEQACNIIGLSLKEAGTTLYPDASETQLADLAAHYREQFTHHNQTPMPLFEGAKEILAQLKEKGMLLSVATGKSRSGLDRVLAAQQMTDWFVCSRTGTEAQSKPSPDMIEQILSELNIEPQHALMVGDTEYDLMMAKNAGVDSIGVSFGVHDVDRLQRCDPIAIIDALPDLINWV